ncbi:MAG: hypothetical protein JW741_27505 [Sedimentisphaerales bacterium]|nr:hypothetical protein [Sedimentisphaerales bacterium]
MATCANSRATLRRLLPPQNQSIRIGVPVGHVLLGDLERLDAEPCRLVIVLSCFASGALLRCSSRPGRNARKTK